MVSVKLLKDLGYIYDLNFIFYLNFNFNSYIETLPVDKQLDSRIEFFDSIREEFGEIPEELYVFYHIIENHKTFMTTSYIVPYNKLFATEFNFKFFLENLQDSDTLIRKMIQFYLYELTPEEVELCAKSNAELFSRIKVSNYTNEDKRKLYEFFIDPIPYIQCLRNQLIEKEVLLSKYYEKHEQKIFDVFNSTTYDSLSKQIRELKDLSFLEENQNVLYISYCLLNIYFMHCFTVNEDVVYLLGFGYSTILDFIKDQNREPSLTQFGNALAEENRALMLQYLLKKEECTCKDFERVFTFSGSTVYHHISYLLRSSLVKTRNIGKTVLYSINRPYIDSIINSLKKFSTQG